MNLFYNPQGVGDVAFYRLNLQMVHLITTRKMM